MSEMSKPVLLREAQESDLSALQALILSLKHDPDPAYGAKLIAEKRLVLLAFIDAQLAGFGVYNPQSAYPSFYRLRIPEIQDLNVAPYYRRQGIATKMMDWFENRARQEGHDLIGLGVGLSREYGNAQKLYTTLGYKADGAGVVYDGQPVQPGDRPPFDHLLCLMMVKSLN